MAGPLAGVRIVEFAGIGPGPFCGMMLADHGAEVIRVERVGRVPTCADAARPDPARDILTRSRRAVALNLKDGRGVALARKLCAAADGLLEGYRPGVMERLGLGPEVLLGDNPRLVYGRMTGWGQEGPYAAMAGHDINYISVSGALHAIGRAAERPVPPLNLIGDFGGGGMMLAFGMVSALLHAQRTGEGQVVDAAMTDGSAVLMATIYSRLANGLWEDERGRNVIDGGAHFYDSYETADGKYVSIGAIEPQFYALLLERLGIAEDPIFAHQRDPRTWSSAKAKIAARFRTRTREEWREIFEGTDACFAPVMSLDEAPDHPHNLARGAFVDVEGTRQPAPAPRYSGTATTPPTPLLRGDEVTADILGLAAGDLDALRREGVIE